MIGLTRLQRRIVFPRHLAAPLPHAGEHLDGLERLWLSTEEGRVEAWYLPAAGASPERPAPLVLYAHGNAELIDYWPEVLEPYRLMGVSVLLPEYRGYGRSAGSPSEEAIASDLERFAAELLARPEVDARRLVYHGRSIGGGAVCALARRLPPAALVLQSTFTSLRDMARRFGLPGFLAPDVMDNLALVSSLDAPIFIAHGRQDELIPFSQADRLHGAAPRSTFLPLQGGHNDTPSDWPSFFDALRAWLESAEILPPRPTSTRFDAPPV